MNSMSAAESSPTDISLSPPTRCAALTASIVLSGLFLVVYSGTNWLTSLRTDVGSWHFEWERLIPFVPWMVIPYMSIDLFFVVSPFLCRRRLDLKILSSRIALAILAAGACFLLFPLRLVAEPPAADGICGWIFDWFRSMDKPYNLCPSLHIALRTILADLYGRTLRGAAYVAAQIWFSLIGFSTLLTYQHHVVDVIGGFILAGLCFYLISETAWRIPLVPNRRMSAIYAIACLGVGVMAAVTWPLGGVLLWPALCLALVAAAYFRIGPGIYRKASGRIPLSGRLVMAPVLFGQYLSLLYYRRQCRPWDVVAPGVWIGRQLNAAEACQARGAGITAVLDLTAEFSESIPFRTLLYQNLPILDLTAPTLEQMRDAVSFIHEQTSGGTVYVHCKVGYSRSAAIVGAYLVASGQYATADDAMARLREVRPSIVIRPEAEAAIRRFEGSLAGNSPRKFAPPNNANHWGATNSH